MPKETQHISMKNEVYVGCCGLNYDSCIHSLKSYEMGPLRNMVK